MGAVYLAEQPGLGREVAIKELIQSAAADPVALKRFLQEAQVMARTSHPNLVQVHDLELMGDANYIVLEFVRGKSLRERLNRGSIPLPQVFAVMHGVLQALDYAHRHAIVHRDMKPENVLLSDEGMVKVADFGIARLTDDSGIGGTATKTGTTVGTPQYMSPEQVASSKVDGRSDLYSAGIMFYELVVGQPPFTASEADGPFTLMAKHVQAPPKPPSVHRPGLDMELEEVILKSLSKRPEDRFQTGQEFDDAIGRALGVVGLLHLVDRHEDFGHARLSLSDIGADAGQCVVDLGVRCTRPHDELGRKAEHEPAQRVDQEQLDEIVERKAEESVDIAARHPSHGGRIA